MRHLHEVFRNVIWFGLRIAANEASDFSTSVDPPQSHKALKMIVRRFSRLAEGLVGIGGQLGSS
jgi:hypothetical protein